MNESRNSVRYIAWVLIAVFVIVVIVLLYYRFSTWNMFENDGVRE